MQSASRLTFYDIFQEVASQTCHDAFISIGSQQRLQCMKVHANRHRVLGTVCIEVYVSRQEARSGCAAGSNGLPCACLQED